MLKTKINRSAEQDADIASNETDEHKYVEIIKYFQSSDSRCDCFNEIDLKPDNTKASIKSLQILKDMFTETNLPDNPITLNDYLLYLKDKIIPSIAPVSSQTYIGHMTSTLPSFMPEFSKLISQLNQNVVKVETSKCITFLERQILAMMHKLFYALPQEFYTLYSQDSQHTFGVVTSGGSVSNLTALWCARNKTLIAKGITYDCLVEQGAMFAQQELGYSGGVIIGSRLMHYSMKKIASLLGIGESSIKCVPQQNDQKISMQDLENCIDEVHENGQYVIALVGVAGATETGTIDPLNNMADIAKEYKIHFHVDAAWGGAIQFSDKYKDKLRGIERADSITICPHKQLYVPQGMSLCLFKNSASAKNIAVHANYQAMEGSYDLGQHSLEGSRPANAILLHAGLHLLSIRGYAWLVEQSMAMTNYFIELIETFDCFELVGKPEINIINYRYIPTHLYRGDKEKYTKEEDKLIDNGVKRIQEIQFYNGKTFVSKTRILDCCYADYPVWVFRVVLSNPLTSKEDLLEVLQEQISIAEGL